MLLPWDKILLLSHVNYVNRIQDTDIVTCTYRSTSIRIYSNYHWNDMQTQYNPMIIQQFEDAAHKFSNKAEA